jgi:hypothetical protein
MTTRKFPDAQRTIKGKVYRYFSCPSSKADAEKQKNKLHKLGYDVALVVISKVPYIYRRKR